MEDAESVADIIAQAAQEHDGELSDLSRLCLQMLAVGQEVEALEAALSAKKRQLQEYRVDKIPNLMQELGVSELVLSSGAKIVIQRVINCRFNVMQKINAFKWLEQHGQASMIKHELAVEFARGESELAAMATEMLTKLGLKPSVSKDVHFQTLSAWARRQVDVGAEVPANLFDLSIVNLAKVKA